MLMGDMSLVGQRPGMTIPAVLGSKGIYTDREKYVLDRGKGEETFAVGSRLPVINQKRISNPS
jgi:hypothetical protein